MIMIISSMLILLIAVLLIDDERTAIEMEELIAGKFESPKGSNIINIMVKMILVLMVVSITAAVDYKMIKLTEYKEVTMDSVENIILTTFIGMAVAISIIMSCGSTKSKKINFLIKERRRRVSEEIRAEVAEYEKMEKT